MYTKLVESYLDDNLDMRGRYINKKVGAYQLIKPLTQGDWYSLRLPDGRGYESFNFLEDLLTFIEEETRLSIIHDDGRFVHGYKWELYSDNYDNYIRYNPNYKRNYRYDVMALR